MFSRLCSTRVTTKTIINGNKQTRLLLPHQTYLNGVDAHERLYLVIDDSRTTALTAICAHQTTVMHGLNPLFISTSSLQIVFTSYYTMRRRAQCVTVRSTLDDGGEARDGVKTPSSEVGRVPVSCPCLFSSTGTTNSKQADLHPPMPSSSGSSHQNRSSVQSSADSLASNQDPSKPDIVCASNEQYALAHPEQSTHARDSSDRLPPPITRNAMDRAHEHNNALIRDSLGGLGQADFNAFIDDPSRTPSVSRTSTGEVEGETARPSLVESSKASFFERIHAFVGGGGKSWWWYRSPTAWEIDFSGLGERV
jgi:hypothetical protein